MSVWFTTLNAGLVTYDWSMNSKEDEMSLTIDEEDSMQFYSGSSLCTFAIPAIYLILAWFKKSKTQLETKQLDRNSKISKVHSG